MVGECGHTVPSQSAAKTGSVLAVNWSGHCMATITNNSYNLGHCDIDCFGRIVWAMSTRRVSQLRCSLYTIFGRARLDEGVGAKPLI